MVADVIEDGIMARHLKEKKYLHGELANSDTLCLRKQLHPFYFFDIFLRCHSCQPILLFFNKIKGK